MLSYIENADSYYFIESARLALLLSSINFLSYIQILNLATDLSDKFRGFESIYDTTMSYPLIEGAVYGLILGVKACAMVFVFI